MEKLLNVWYNTLSDGIAFLSATQRDNNGAIDFRYQLVNRAFAVLLGQDQDKLIGRSFESHFLRAHDQDLCIALKSVFESGISRQIDLVNTRETGDQVWLTITLTRIDDQLMINVQDISERKEAELNLERRLAKESLIVTISSRLLTLRTHQVNAYIEIALMEVSQHVNAERATVVHYSDDNQRGDCTHEWCAPGVDSQKSSLQNIPLSSFPGICQILNEGQVFQVNSDTLQDEAVQEKGSFLTSAAYSVLAIPLIQEEKTNGFIAFHSISKPKQWDHHDISFLESFCTLIANCIDKVKKELEISRANFRLEGLREIDQALLSSRLSDRPPLFIALKYIYFMVPSERVTVFIIDEATNMAVAKCRMINGEINLHPDFSIPASYFHEQFRHNKPSVYYENVKERSAGLNELIPNYEETYQSVLIVPLLYKGICIGAFTLGATTAYFFTEEYQQIAEELAYQIAIILYQQQLDEQLKLYTDQLEQRVLERTREVNELSTLHQAILKHAGQAIISTDIYGVVQTANQACENLLGFTTEELIGRFIRIEPGPPTDPVPYISYLTDLQSELPSNNLLDGLAARGYLYGEYKAVGKNGTPIPVLLATSILADENEVTIGYVGIITDISALKIAEARLQHKNKELNAIFDGAIDLHCLIDSHGKLVNVNRAWEVILGYSAQELETRSFWQLARADEQFIVSDNLQLVKTNQSLRNQTNQFQKKDGHYLVLEWNAVGIEDQIYVSARDITIRQQSEVQLRSLNQRLQLATQATGQGIWEKDFVNDEVIWDDRIWTMYGLEPQQGNWTYHNFLKYIHPDDLNAFLVSVRKNMQSQTDVFVNTFRIIRPDGLIRHIENTGMVLRNKVNKPVRMIGVTRDVTERWLAEETLRESEQRFREIAENVDEVFFIHSAEPFSLLYINPAYERIWNRTTQSLYENPYSFLDIVLDEDKPDLIEFFQQYRNGKEGQIIYRIRNPDGSFQWLLFRSFVKRDDNGNIIRLIGIINDITGQKEKEIVLQQALQREQQLNQLKSQFVSTASHEFRTPLATIQTSVELVKLYLETPDPGAKVSIQKHLSVIEKEVDSFSLLLSDILTIEKIESGKVSFSPQWVDIVYTCKHIIATHFCQGTDKRTIQLTIEGNPSQVYVDEKLISHVIINLVSNAFKFSQSSPSLTISFLDDRFLLHVTDDGIGIPESEIATLFQSFFRATNTIGIPGTGLGLVIAMQFVELHGGTITVQSKEKKGTTFRVSLPIHGHDTAIAHYPGQPTPVSVQKTA